MKLSDFDYSLPKELIAQYPLKKRDSCRLMVIDRKSNAVSHRIFSDFAEYVGPHDIVVVNNTKVVPVRFLGVKKDTLGKVDVLLSERLSPRSFRALIKPNLKTGQEVLFNAPAGLGVNGILKARVIDEKVIEFNKNISSKIVEAIGVMPLPPYIKRQPQKLDILSYQTVYAKKPGAIASPTAGLHFTKTILERIRKKKVRIDSVTLHVGLGTFKPVKCENIQEHVMEKEAFHISKKTLQAIAQAKKNGKRIFAVGTTTTRVLETAAELAAKSPSSIVHRPSSQGYTNLFIYPGYQFKMVDALVTNFHLPKTTLFILVCAFAGRDLIMKAYNEAIKEKYRFYSYGDAMLI